MTTMVCLSEWQAGLFRELGHDCVVIPSHIPDEYYDAPKTKAAEAFGCFSAWNKGTDATLEAWSAIGRPGRLYVGCPYSAPSDAAERCRAHGAFWVGTLRPRDWLTYMQTIEAHVRVCNIGETFGVTDAIAEAMGARVHVWCTGDKGALPSTLAHRVSSSLEEWRSSIYERRGPEREIPNYRASRILPMWLELLGR